MHFVASLKAVISDFAGVVNGVPLLLHVNFTVPVGQVKKGLSGPHRELRGNVETEKPHSWLTVAGDVCTNVDFREVGNGIECRAVPQRYAAMSNGTMAIHALPSYRSISRGRGICFLRS